MAQQLEGAEKLAGTYPFTHAASLKGVPAEQVPPQHDRSRASREILADPEASFAEAGLTGEEKDLVRRRDWRGMIHYGVIFFMLEKLGATWARRICTSTRRCAASRSRSS